MIIKYSIFYNTDLTFKSRTHQGRRVNSHPPDGVDLCQLHHIQCNIKTVFFQISINKILLKIIRGE